MDFLGCVDELVDVGVVVLNVLEPLFVDVGPAPEVLVASGWPVDTGGVGLILVANAPAS